MKKLDDWQIEIIRNSSLSHASASKMAGVSYSAVKYHRGKLGVQVSEESKSISYWSPDELETLQNSGDLTNAQLANKMNRSEKAVQVKRSKVQLLGPTNRWSDEDKAYLIDNYGILSARKIASHLGRTIQAVVSFANSLGLSRKNSFWSKADVKVLQENIEKTPTELLDYLPQKTIEQISYKKTFLNFLNKQKLEGDDHGIESAVKVSAFSRTIKYAELLNTLKIGESFEYPVSDKARISMAQRDLAHKRFITKKVDEHVRRLWRVG